MLDVCLKRLAAENVVDPFNFLRKIRSQRNFMVQTEVQFTRKEFDKLTHEY